MADENRLKLVKVNQREVQEPIYHSKYSLKPSGMKTKKVHDLEYHNAQTNEPVFTVHSDGYSRDTKNRIAWHPYQLEQHPGLDTSFEHGSRHPDYDRMKAGSKETLGYRAEGVYKHALDRDFKDKLPSKMTAVEGNPNRRITTIYDPDTDEPIVTHHPDKGTKYHSQYLQNHGIDKNLVGTLGDHPYTLATGLYNEKGKDYAAIGHKSAQGTGSVYNFGKNKTPEEVSAAHEAKIRERYGKAGGQLSVTRHSPTSFSVHHNPDEEGDEPSKYSSDTYIHSHAMPHGQLVSHKFKADRDFGRKLTDKF